MQDHNQRINRILYSIDKNQFDDDTLDIIIMNYFNTDKIENSMKLNKIKTVNNVNVYENSCSILFISSVIIKLCHEFFNDLLKGNRDLYIIDDDINYNHINDVCGNVYHLKNYELSYSVYNNLYEKSAITLVVDPLKYPGLVSLVLFEFLTINNYPQDIKNCILLLYNDVR